MNGVMKARSVEFSFNADDAHPEEAKRIWDLVSKGPQSFGGKTQMLKLTDYLTISNVLAIESIVTKVDTRPKHQYLTGESSLAYASVTVKLLIWDVADVAPLNENLLSTSPKMIG